MCFRREGSDEDNEALHRRVNATGEIFISHTRLDGRYVLRFAVGNARTTEDHVRRALGGVSALRAVIFDLWDHARALAEPRCFEHVKRSLSPDISDSTCGATTYYDRQAARPMDAYFRGLGLDEETVSTCVRLRSEFTRDALVPREGAIETLDELRVAASSAA